MAGLKAMVEQKNPALKSKDGKDWLDFAQSHQHWTVNDWKRIMWSDETKINRLGSDGRKWAWKSPGETLNDRLLEPTVKFGGGCLMLWGCMS